MRIIHLTTGRTVKHLPRGTVMVLGFFDGVHKGHRALFADAKKFHASVCDGAGTWQEEAKRYHAGAGICAWTFEALPKGNGRLLTTTEEKCRLLKEAGADYVVFEDYNEVCGMRGEEFLEERISAQFDPAGLLSGSDFRFGRDADCDVWTLASRRGEAWCRTLNVLRDPESGEVISSSLIRRLLEEGKPADAARLMGSRYSVTGKVVHGQGLGKKLGHPTINQFFPADKLIPMCGAYSCLVTIGGKKYAGVCNIGCRPTVAKEKTEPTLETWLPDYKGNLYGRTVTTELVDFLRPEEKFDSPEALSAAIEKDAEAAKKSLSRLAEGV